MRPLAFGDTSVNGFLFYTISEFQSLILNFFLKFKYCHAIRGKRIRKGIFPAVTLLFDSLVHLRSLLALAAVFYIITVQYQLILLSPRHAHAVILPLHRRKIADKEEILLSVLRMSDKAVNAAEPVIGVNPLEAFRLVIQLIHRLILPV